MARLTYERRLELIGVTYGLIVFLIAAGLMYSEPYAGLLVLFGGAALGVFAGLLLRRPATPRPPRLGQEVVDTRFWELAKQFTPAPYLPAPQPGTPEDGEPL